jgi:hypothetical protein
VADAFFVLASLFSLDPNDCSATCRAHASTHGRSASGTASREEIALGLDPVQQLNKSIARPLTLLQPTGQTDEWGPLTGSLQPTALLSFECGHFGWPRDRRGD